MRKAIISSLYAVIFIVGVTPFLAQDLTSKLGEPILPKEKDWSIGIDATRLIKDANFTFLNTSQAVTGKYFKSATTAYRAAVRLGFNSWTSKNMVVDRVAATSSVVAYPAAVVMKENSWRRSSTAIGLSFGIEKRRGLTRLQGIYGVEGGVYVSTTRDRFSYGNKLDASSIPQVIVDSTDAMSSVYFGAANNVVANAPIQGVIGRARITERKNGMTLSLGARLFIGAEYFVLPKLSLGGEFGWGLGVSFTGRSETTYESIGQSNIQGSTQPSAKQTTVDGSTNTYVGLDTDNANMFGGVSASLRVNLYF